MTRLREKRKKERKKIRKKERKTNDELLGKKQIRMKGSKKEKKKEL